MSEDVRATVVWGANNIYHLVAFDGCEHRNIRIKGKVLPGAEDEYNPLAPGDVVMLERADELRIVRREPRRNRVTRWNRKGLSLQTVAANVDRVVVVVSLESPRFRPRFADRVLVMTTLESLNAIIVLTKTDLVSRDEADAAAARVEVLGYGVYRTGFTATADVPDETERLRAELHGTSAVFFGQSGVGKSSLINRLIPDARLEVREVSDRFNRGRHTTTLARAVRCAEGFTIVDTPGVREFDLYQYSPVEIAAGFIEMRDLITDCRLPSCTHVHEPGCTVRAAVAVGRVSADRYESYLRIIAELGDTRGS